MLFISIAEYSNIINKSIFSFVNNIMENSIVEREDGDRILYRPV
jgi:hypothetical protein